MNKLLSPLLVIILLSFLVRFWNLDFPSFNTEEARIAGRGYFLVTTGQDELGRKMPFLFNSLEDYQLPAVSYLTAGGIFIFGKTDFGARIPFILAGTLLVLLIYKISIKITGSKTAGLLSAFILAFSPNLIFLSKTPNETIILVFIFSLLFYLFLNQNTSQLCCGDEWFEKNLPEGIPRSLLRGSSFLIGARISIIFLTIIIALLVSKLTWFIMVPFVLLSLLISENSLKLKRSLLIIVMTVLAITSIFSLFLTIPQSKRSLMENNFPLFTDVTIKNGIDRLRGQGIESGWPDIVSKLLFNKTHFLIVGIVHWFSHLNLYYYFGKLDESGRTNFSALGVFAKILLIPFIYGIIYFLKRESFQNTYILLLPLVLTYPTLFLYPNNNLELISLTAPFIALIIASGGTKMNKKIVAIFGLLVIFELGINIFNLPSEHKNSDLLRPAWINDVTIELTDISKVSKVAISDDVVSDISSYIYWYTSQRFDATLDIPWPYKFRQYNLANILVLGSDKEFTSCSKNEHWIIFASKRDLNRIQRKFMVNIIRTYEDTLGQIKFYKIEGVCIK